MSKLFKKFFFYISLPTKSDADLKVLANDHPKAVKITKFIKTILGLIGVYIDMWNVNELLKMFGKGFKNFPDVTKLFVKTAVA